jgi:hypothetical protein
LYKELVGSTAVRKSSKIKDLVEEFAKRIPGIEGKEDLVNYTYFLIRLHDFDIVTRIDPKLRGSLVAKGI